jgi:hypothetical protein
MNPAYHLALAKGRFLRARYLSSLARHGTAASIVADPIDVEVFSYSGEGALAEQVASLHSFLRFVGRPRGFTVVSDGTHRSRSIKQLQEVDESVRVLPSDQFQPSDLPVKMSAYLRTHPTGRQLAIAMSLPKHGPALYLDSDVLFFAGASALRREIQRDDAPALYLRDCRLSGDDNVLRADEKILEPVNAGFLVLLEKLDWSLAIDRFMKMKAPPTFFTNQSLLHVVLHANGARPLDPARYVVQLDDQTGWGDRHAASSLVLRHYVNPVRHKLWEHVRS